MTVSADEDRDAHRLDTQLLSDLWVFRAAARFGSITAAARHLNVTQGAVSQRVLRLEARLGTPLFVRHKSRIALTEAGTSLLEAMTSVASTLNDALSRINRQQRGALVVSCVPSLAMEWLVPHLEDFYREYPGIEVFVRSELVPFTADRMDDEGIDISIDYAPRPLEGLHELATLQEMIFPVCSRAYRDRIDAGDAGEPLVLLQDDVPWLAGAEGNEWDIWRAALAVDWPDRPTVRRHFNLSHLTYHAAMCDQGVAIGRATLVNRLMARGELVEATDFLPVPGAIYRALSHRPGDMRSPVRRFAIWLARAMAETQRHTLTLLNHGDIPHDV